MSDYLPKELIIEIMRRLPPTTLVKFTTVCKAWYSTIKSHAFVSSHVQHSLANPTTPSFLLLRHRHPSPSKEHYSLYSDATSFHTIARLQPPSAASIAVPSSFLSLVGTVNGVVCLYDHSSVGPACVTILWNPMIHRHVQLPSPLFTHADYLFVLGFGFDSKKNDFKVVRVCYRVGPPLVELYSLNEGAWRAIDAPRFMLDLRAVEGSTKHCFLNGSVHWLACQRFQRHAPFQRKCLLTFNVEEETFKKMKLPEELVTKVHLRLDISVIEGCFSVLEYYYHSGICREEARECNIWMWREYGVADSWSKMFSVNLPGGIARVFGLRTNGVVLVVPVGDGETVSLHSFDPKIQNMTKLGIQSTKPGFCATDYNGFLACDYTGSLALFT